jgi:DNA polymerase
MTELWSLDWKLERIQELFNEWDDCDRCRLHESRTTIVFGEGNLEADFMFIGEGPGDEEDQTGDPFIGNSGKLLNDLLEAVGIDREDVFITNMVMCRPPSNRDPTKLERESCSPRLWEQIRVVDPRLIIPVGKVVMKALMGNKWTSILDNQNGHGQLGEIKVPAVQHVEPVRYPAMPIIHPNYILKTDSIDPTTGHWQENGPCHQTIKDLTQALDMVQFLKKQYNKSQDAYQGHPALRVTQ